MIRLCVALFVALSFSGPLAAQSAHDLGISSAKVRERWRNSPAAPI
jgi:hypothetical protein